MKRETLRHPKTYDLAARLGCSRPEALGYLTLLWDYTSEVAPQGDIGKWPNGAIARGCDFDGCPDEFVEALVGAGWLDEDETHRLIIHDIEHHAEQWWKQKVKKLGLKFAKPTAVASAVPAERGPNPESVPAERGPNPESVNTAPRDRTEPNLTEPNQAANADRVRRFEYPDWFEKLWKQYPPRGNHRPNKRAGYDAAVSLGFDTDVDAKQQLSVAVSRYRSHCEETGTAPRDFARFLEDDFWQDFLNTASEPVTARPPPTEAEQRDKIRYQVAQACKSAGISWDWIDEPPDGQSFGEFRQWAKSELEQRTTQEPAA